MLSLSTCYVGHTDNETQTLTRITNQETMIVYYFDLTNEPELTHDQFCEAIKNWHGDIPIAVDQIARKQWRGFIE